MEAVLQAAGLCILLPLVQLIAVAYTVPPQVASAGCSSNDPAARYQQLGNLVATMPDLDTDAYCNRPKAVFGLGGGCAGGSWGDVVGIRYVKTATDGLGSPATLPGGVSLHPGTAHKIISVLHRALARAELAAPVATQALFIPVGASFTAVDALTKIFGTATASVLIVDPYADANLLSISRYWCPKVCG